MAKRKRPNQMWHEVIIRAWKDPELKERFLQDPRGALRELGIEVISDQQIEEISKMILSSPVEYKEISEGELAKVAGGKYLATVSWLDDRGNPVLRCGFMC